MRYPSLVIIGMTTFLMSIGKVHAQQPYSHYLDNSCEWYVYHSYFDFINYGSSYITYYIDGDTIINNQSYFKEYYMKIDSIFPQSIPGPPRQEISGPIYSRSIREDSLKRFYIATNTTEILINDFSLQVNDSFPGTTCPIYSIDTLYLGSNPLKRFNPQSVTFGGVAIEGVGNAGPICGVGIEGNATLVCFHKQNNWLHVDSSKSCNLFLPPARNFTSASALTDLDTTFRLFPNPVHDNITIRFQQEGTRNAFIINGLGKQLMELKLNDVFNKINVQELAAGTYFLLINDHMNTKSFKFIKE